MIRFLIYDRFGVFCSANYIARLLGNMGFSYRKARFVPSRADRTARREWLKTTWAEVLGTTEEKNALILSETRLPFPNGEHFPIHGRKRDAGPLVRTSGIRKSYEVFGPIGYFPGRFFCKGHEGCPDSESYAAFPKGVMRKTRSKHLILIRNGAPYHRSKAMKNFFGKHSHRITVCKLPAYSPDYNPIGMLWKKTEEK